MDRKKEKKQKKEWVIRLQQFRQKQLNDFKEKVIIPIEKLRWKKIKAFKDEWGLSDKKIKNNKDLEDWYNKVQIEHPEKKYPVLIFEVEKFHVIKNGKIVKTINSTSVEFEPRVMSLGDNPKVIFDYEVKKLMNKLRLDPDWATLFKQYLLFNQDFVKFIDIPSVVISERVTYSTDLPKLEHRIALNISPNTPLEEIELLWKPIIEPLQQKIKGNWLYKKRQTKLSPIFLKLIDLDIEDQKTGKYRSDYEKTDILFGSIDDNKKYNNWSNEKITREENKRIKRLANLRRQCKKYLLSQ